MAQSFGSQQWRNLQGNYGSEHRKALHAQQRLILDQRGVKEGAKRASPRVGYYEDRMAEYQEITPETEVDFSVIYNDPEPSWPWTYEYPQYQLSQYYGVTLEIIENLSQEYASCDEAWQDLLYWFGVAYGDLYGNRGVNTSLFYIWNILAFKLPQLW